MQSEWRLWVYFVLSDFGMLISAALMSDSFQQSMSCRLRRNLQQKCQLQHTLMEMLQ